MDRSELTRVAVEESSASGDPIATALLAAWKEIDSLKDLLDGRRMCVSVEEAAMLSGVGLSNFAKGIRTDYYPHIHVGAQEGIAKIPVRALSDFLYQQAMSHTAAPQGSSTGRSVA